MQPPRLGLWHRPDFLKLWTGQVVSQFGSTATREALALTPVLLLGATPLQMGVLASATSAPAVVLGLVAGVLVDRVRRRPVMITADLLRAALLLSIPLAAITHRLSFGLLLAVSALVGVLSVAFDVAYRAYVPGLVGREELLEANSKLGYVESLAEVTAPGLGGALVQALTAPMAILVDSLSFLASAWSLWLIRTTEAATAPRGETSLAHDIADGLRAVWRDPVLRAFAANGATQSFFGGFFYALYGLYCIRVLGMGPALLGLTVACGGAGSLLGAFVVHALVRRFGYGRAIIGAIVLSSPFGFLTPLATGPLALATAMMMTSQIVGDAAGTVQDIAALTIRQTRTPQHRLGRVQASTSLLATAVLPAGSLLGGLLGAAVGPRVALAVAITGMELGSLWIVLSPVRSLEAFDPSGIPTVEAAAT